MKLRLSKSQIGKIKTALFTSPYYFYFLLSSIVFLLLNIYINKIYIEGLGFFRLEWYIMLPYLFFTIFNTLLTALNINLIIMRSKELNTFKTTGGILSAIGSSFALVTGACPGCIAGIFPTIMGIIGSTLTLNQLPLAGLEIQIASSVLLLIGTYQLTKPMTCKI